MLATRRAQRGAAMVEMAITVSLFMMLVFGIIEFSMAYFQWTRMNEAARDASRYAIVNDPIVDLSTLSCPGGAAIEVDCGSSDCGVLLDTARKVGTFLEPGNVHVRYACSDAGNPARPSELSIPEVTVEIRNVHYSFVVPSLIGLGATMGLPAARATRTGEDLETVGGG